MNREILRLAIPNILSNLSIPLLSTVDTALMGRLSEEHIGAVGLGSMIFNFIYWNFGFLRMGTTGITAQFFGSDNRSAIVETLARALLIALGVAISLLALQIPLREAGAFLLNAEEGSAGEYVRLYFDIRIWAAPATLALFAMMGWFFGMQNAIFPLIITVGVNVVNIVVSYVLVYEFGMEIGGVAWGTVVAQYFGILLSMALFAMRYREHVADLRRDALMNIEAFRKFLGINRDIFLRTLCLTFAFGFFYSRSSALGDGMLAVNVILLQYVNWLSYAIDGFAYATESIVGKYFGAKSDSQVYKAIRYNFAWGLVVAVLFAGAYLLAGEPLLRVFTDQKDVIELSMPFLIWMVIIPIIGYPSYIWDGIFVGLTASRAMRDSMALALVVFLAAYYGFLADQGNHGLWLSFTIFLLARGVLQWVWFYRKGLSIR